MFTWIVSGIEIHIYSRKLQKNINISRLYNPSFFVSFSPFISSFEFEFKLRINSYGYQIKRLTEYILDNLVLSTELIMWIGHRKEIRKLTFRALALRRSESRNCGLCVVYIQKYGATLLVGAWQREKQQNKLVE